MVAAFRDELAEGMGAEALEAEFATGTGLLPVDAAALGKQAWSG